MNKKSIFITASVLILLFVSYEIVSKVINTTLDDANRRGIELYASTVKYAYTEYIYKNGFSPNSIDELNIVLTTEVECKDKKLYSNGNVELYGCTVEDSKIKYNYVNGKVVRLK